MTDERMGDRLLPSIAALPRGSGVIFRHYETPAKARRVVFDAVVKIARARRLVLLEGGVGHGRHWGAITAPVHSIPERIAAERSGAVALFISPVFPTQSHKGAPTLGRIKLGMMMRGAKCPVIALGGMTAARAKSLSLLGVYGWAGIDALTIRT
jgi:thiamine-phosphate pyrophosphorylase